MPLGERLRGQIRHGLFNPTVTLAVPWLSGWQYRKSHVIDAASGAGVGYQVRVKVYRSTGTDSDENVYVGNKCRADFADLRFAGNDGTTLLDHWKEQILSAWPKYSGNPILSPEGDETHTTFASVVKDGSTYWLYYGYVLAGKWVIGRASSTDKVTFTKDTAHNPVIQGSAGQWDEGGIAVAMVWKEGTTWYMMYRGCPLAGTCNIGLATSTDGYTWTKSASNPVLTGGVGWDNDSIDPWGVIKIGSTYYLWYSTVSGADRATGLATSTNLTSWTKDSNNPIFTGNRFCGFAFKYESFYYMVISAASAMELYTDSNPTFYSDSRELLGEVFTKGSAGQWDSQTLDTPCILTDDVTRTTFPDDQLYCYYAGLDASLVTREGVTVEDLGAALGTTAIFWVEVADDLSTTSTKIYLYYGKSDATSLSNGPATFLFFDDFELGDLSRWTNAGSDWVDQSSVKKFGVYAARATRTGATVDLRTLWKDLTSLALTKGKVQFYVRGQAGSVIHYFFLPWDDAGGLMYLLTLFNDGHFKYSQPGVGWLNLPVDTLWVGATWYKIMVTWDYSTGKYDVWIDEVKKSGSGISGVLTGSFIAKVNAYSADTTNIVTYLDHYIVAKYVSPEPSHGTWGVEESAS